MKRRARTENWDGTYTGHSLAAYEILFTKSRYGVKRREVYEKLFRCILRCYIAHFSPRKSKSSLTLNLKIAVFRRFLQAAFGAHLYGFLPQTAISSEERQHEAEGSRKVPQHLVSFNEYFH